MAAAGFVVSLVLLLAVADHSDGSYCVCNSGASESVLQKNIDFACGAGADCSPILQNGPCYSPNSLKDHCNYAVNSYYQRKGQITGSCDFQGSATVSANPPSAASGCVYPSSSSGSTPTGSTTVGGGSTNGGSGTNTGLTPGSVLAPPGGSSLAPTGGFSDPNNSVGTLSQSSCSLVLVPISLVVLIYGFIWPRF